MAGPSVQILETADAVGAVTTTLAPAHPEAQLHPAGPAHAGGLAPLPVA